MTIDRLASSPFRDGRRWVALLLGLFAMLVFVQAELGAQATYRFHSVTVNEGLSQGFVNAIIQDTQGFMWFGTNDGLNRYDGYRVRIFRPDVDDSMAIRDHIVLSLLDDGAGHVWIGTRQGGVRRLDLRTNRFSNVPLPTTDQALAVNEPVVKLHRDRSGRIWALTPQTILQYDSLHNVFDRFAPPNIPGPAVFSNMAEQSDGTLWISTRLQGLFRIPPDRSSIAYVDVDIPSRLHTRPTELTTITIDRQDNAWLGYTTVILQVSAENVRISSASPGRPLVIQASFPGASPENIVEDGKGRIWASRMAYESVMILDPFHGTSQLLVPDHSDVRGLPTGSISCLFRDRSGSMWLGTNGNGVSHEAASYSRFPVLLQDAPLSFRSIRAIHEDHVGNLWIGGYGQAPGAGLDVIDAKTGKVSSYTVGRGRRQLPQSDVWTIYQDPPDRGGILWLGLDGGGVLRLDPRTQMATPVSPGQTGMHSIRALARDRRGTLWVGTQTGLYAVDEDLQQMILPHFNLRDDDGAVITALTKAEVFRVTELSATPGLLWVCTSDGLVCYDPRSGTGVLFGISTRPGSLRSSYVLSIHEDERGRIWVATGGAGFARMTLPAEGTSGLPAPSEVIFHHYTMEDGLPNEYVYGILNGDRGDIWMSTNRGLARFDPETETFRSYDVTDGLQNNEFNKNAFCRTRSGELLFGGVVGVNRFRPSDLQDNPHAPQVVITELKVFNEPLDLPRAVSWTDEVTLSHEDRVITLEFVALEYTSPDRNQYRYQLEGFDPRWVEAGGNRSATYTNLEPGEYTFRVTGSNNDGVWNPVGTSLRIVMLPPFWKTVWFRGTAAVLIVAGVYGSSRYRTRRMEARNRELELRVRERTAEWEAANAELEAFSYTVSHDLRAPVRAINGYTRMLMEEHASTLDPEGKRMLGVIATRTKRMGEMIDDLLMFSRTGRQTIVPARVEMTDLATSVANDLAPKDGRGHSHVIIGSLPAVHGDAALLRQVWVNLISNAVKFSSDVEHPVIEVGSREESNGVVYWVRDNGVGFDMAYQHKLFGVFERLHSQEEFEGTGVGLAIAHRVVIRHGGRIWAESEKGKGATFFFFIPQPRAAG